MKIGILCPPTQYKNRFAGLVQYLESKGHAVHSDPRWLSGVGGYDAIFTWNGYTPKDYRLRKWARKLDCKVFYIESGFFSQKTHSIISKTVPIGGLFLKNVELPTLTEKQELFLQQEYLKYSKGIEYEGGNYILAIFQLPKDKSIVKQSRFRSLQQFADEVERLYPNDTIIYKTHPREKYRSVKTRHKIYTGKKLYEYISKAKLTIAINSTVLFEAAYAGCPVQALGKSPFATHPDNPRGIVYETYHRQIPLNDPNIETQMTRVFGDYFG